MSFDSWLIHTATVQHATDVDNAYGNSTPAWETDPQVIECRFIERRERIFGDRDAQSMAVTAYTLLVGPDADILERDRISSVTFEDGTVQAGVYVVKSLLERRGTSRRHKSAELERIA
jgi:hypothetical protein